MIRIVLIEKHENTRRRYNGEHSTLQIERLNRPSVMNNDSLNELSRQALREIKRFDYPQSVHGYVVYDDKDNELCERYEYSCSVNEMSFFND